MVNPIPKEYPQVSPYLCCDDASGEIEFCCTVFDAKERTRMPMPGGKIGHCELQIGDSVIMLSDEMPEMGIRGPKSIGGTPVTLSVYVADVDECFDKALKAGATMVRAVEDQFYGDRSGQFLDPCGHRWSVASHIEDVSPDEMQRRAAEVTGGS